MKNKVLIIDDSALMRRVLKRILTTHEIPSVEANSGERALECLSRDDSIGLALVDWSMPHMTGLEFVQKVRRAQRFKSLKLLMVSAHDTEEDIQKAITAGVDDFLHKPISKKLVAEKLRQHGFN